MFCMNCGTKFEGEFCPSCGKKMGDGMEKELQQSRELQILRNARDCLIKLEQYNVKLEMAIAQEVYINNLIESKQEEIKQKSLELEKIGETSEEGISKGKAVLAAYTLGASLLFTGIHKNKDKNKKYIAAKEETTIKVKELEDEIEKLKKYCSNYEVQTETIYREAKAVLASDKWKEAKTIINPSYLDVDSIILLIEYLTYGRANTWKEACNLLEDERYKATMINLNMAQLSTQQQMLETQNELVNLTVESIELQKESLELQWESVKMQEQGLELQEQGLGLQLEGIDLQKQSIDIQRQQIMQAYQMNDFLGKQLQEVQKMRKDTKKTARAAKISAFLNVLDALTVDTVKIKWR